MAKKIRIIPWLDESQLNRQLKDLGKRKQKIQVDIDSKGINSVTNGVRQMNSAVNNSNSLFGKLKTTISSTFSSGKLAMTGYLMVFREINKASQNAKQSIQEIDKAVTDLSIATGQSRESVGALVNDYNKLAKNLSSTTTQITSAADDYLRAGKTMSEAQALIKDSIMLSKLGQLDSSDATADLLAVMNGYEMSIDEVGKALDSMVAIDMAAATSSGDIATALKYCASSADVAGVSFDKLAAMIGTVQDKTQQSAETVGTFMNTLLSRYRDVKIGRFVDDDGEDLSDVESVLGTLNIRLRDTEGEFRNFETVIDEVAQSWDNYSSVQQAAIAKAFSGTRQQNRFIALMEGYNKTLELTKVAANSAGTALEKFNNSYINSLEAQQNRLQASFESMVINSDFDEIYSGIIQATTALVEFINQTNALKGVLTGLAVSSGIKFFLAAKTGASEAYISLNQFANALKIVKQTNIPTDDFNKLLLLSNGLSDSQMKLLLSSKSLTIAQKELILVNSGLSTEEAKLKLQTWGMTTAQTGLTAATTTLGNAFKGLIATMAANPIMIATMAISGAVMAYQSYNRKLEETRQKNLEVSDAAIEHANSLRELYTEYNRLSSVQGRTTAEEENFKTVIEDITKALGGKTEALQGLTAGTKEYADALARATKEELQAAAVEATIGRKAAEEELQKDVWSKWKGSLVSVDSNSKGKSLSEEAQKAADVISDALKDFETVNRTWNNFSWDISSDDPEEILSYYNVLIKAREQLVLASKDDEDLLNTEIYTDLNTAINAMSDSLDVYLQKRYEEEKLNYMVQNGIPSTTEEYNGMESALMSAAGASEDLQNSFKQLLVEDFSGLAADIDDVSKAVDAVSDNPADTPLLSVSQTVDQLNTQLKPAFDSLKSAYQDIFTDDGFKLNEIDILSTCDAIKSKLDEIAKINPDFDYSAYEDFVRVLSDAESTESDVEDAFDSLATSITNAALTGTEDFETLKAALEDLGVANSELVAFGDLISSTEALKNAGLDLADASDEQIQAFAEEMVSAENLGQAIDMLTFRKQICDAQNMDTAEEVANLKALAENAGYTGEVIQYLTELEQIYQAVASGVYGTNTQQAAMAKQRAAELQKLITSSAGQIEFKPKVNYAGGSGSGSKGSAGSAGKEAGDAYVEAFEKELEKLKDLRDRGVIDESEYLDRLRQLYIRYFADRKEYLDEFNKYEREYLEGMKSLYDDALSGITTLLDRQINGYNDEKDAAVDALEAERDARLEVIEAQKEQLQAQIDLIEEQIDAKQKVIDSIQDEIDAMREANEERERELNLQQDLYNLARMESQRTILQYSEDKGMHYVTDDSGLHDARQKVEDDKLEIEIAKKEKQIDLIEKEIDLLEEQKDAIQDQIDALEEQSDSIEKYYSKMIESTEKYYDSLIKNLENQKSKWEELADIEKIAEAYSAVEQVFGELGYTVEDVLSGNAQAFEDFKAKYLSIMSDLNSNTSFAEGLSYASGVAKDNLGSFLDKTKETADGLDTLGDKASALDGVADSMDTMSSSAASLSSNTEGLSNHLEGISSSLTNLPDSEKFSGWVTAFQDLADAIQSVSDALGIGAEGSVGGLIEALTSLSMLSIGTEEEGIVGQFNALKQAVDEVVSAISGGGSASGGNNASGKSGSDGASEGTGSLVGAINSMKQAVDTALGGGGGEDSGDGKSGDADGGSGAIGQFEQLKTAVDDVTSSIGGSDGEGDSGNAEAETLIGAINDLGDTTTEILSGGDDGSESGGVISRFEEFRDVIGEAKDHVQGISDGLDAIDGQEVECTIKVNIETTGGLPAGIADVAGTALNDMNLNSAEYKAKYGSAYAEGTALISGNWAVQSDEKQALLGEVGYEIVVRNGRFFTVGDSGAEMFHIKPGDIVFNHEQSENLLKYGHISGRGKAYADGTVGNPVASGKIGFLQPGDYLYDMTQKFEAYCSKVDDGFNALAAPVYDIQKDMERAVEQISSINNINNSRMQNVNVGDIHITCPGVTSQEVAAQIPIEVNKMFQGLGLMALQNSKIH